VACRFLFLGRLPNHRRNILADAFVLAFVLGKLKPKTLLRVSNPLHGAHGNFEFAIAKRTYSNSWDCAQPFNRPKVTLWHGHSFPQNECPSQLVHSVTTPSGTLSSNTARQRLFLACRHACSERAWQTTLPQSGHELPPLRKLRLQLPGLRGIVGLLPATGTDGSLRRASAEGYFEF
jgi:hypothetical protein